MGFRWRASRVVNPISSALPWTLAQPKLSVALNPILNLPIINGLQLNNIKLAATTPLAINHLLQRMPQGWVVTDNNSNVTIWRTQPYNTNTITLEASAATTISLWVY